MITKTKFFYGDKFEELIKSLHEEYEKLVEYNSKLKEENECLKSEHYKDQELRKMEQLNKELFKRCCYYGL